MLRHEQIQILLDGLFQRVALVLLHELAEDDAAHTLLHTDLSGVEIDEVLHIDHAVTEHTDGLAVHLQVHVHDASVVDRLGTLAREHLARLGQNLAGQRVGNGRGQLKPGDAGAQRQLLIEFIAADVGNVVAAAVKEQAVQQRFGAFHRRGIARAQLAVDLKQRLLAGDVGVLVQRGDDTRVVAEHFLELLVRHRAGGHAGDAGQPGVRIVRLVSAHRLQEPGHGELAVFINAAIENVVQVGLVLQPRAVVRDHRRAVGRVVRLIGALVIIHAGRTHDLRNDDALRAVDDERAARRHEREVAHEDLLFLDLLGLLVAQTNADLQRSGIRGVARLALLLRVLRLLVHGIIHKAQLQIAGIVGHRVNVLKYVAQPLLQEPFVRILLDLQKVRHALDLLVTSKAHSFGFPVGYCLWHREHSFSLSFQTPGSVVKYFLSPVAFLRPFLYNTSVMKVGEFPLPQKVIA